LVVEREWRDGGCCECFGLSGRRIGGCSEARS
jgi:hypothetical protein